MHTNTEKLMIISRYQLYILYAQFILVSGFDLSFK